MLAGQCLLRTGFSERVEESWTNEQFDCRGEYETSENNGSEREQKFFSHCRTRDYQWQKRERRGKRGHHDRYHPFERSADYQLFRPFHLILAHEVKIVRNEHDSVAGNYTDKGDESDEMRGRQDVSRYENGYHST